MRIITICATLLSPAFALAADITIANAIVPLAPKSAMAHAAYMELTNTGDTTRSIIGVTAPNYAMAHLHQSQDTNGIATMTTIDQLDIQPGQPLRMEPGGLHVMLIKPAVSLALGDTVIFEVQFASGDTMTVTADVLRFGEF